MIRRLISERENELPVSTIGKLISIAEENRSIISLGPGEPDFDSPKNIIVAAKKALDSGKTHYSPPAGMKSLREAISRKLKKDNRVDADPDNVIVTCGSTESLILSLISTIDPGEGVILTDPGFLAYKPMVEVLNGMPISVPLEEENGFQISMDYVRNSIVKEKTNAIIINTPINPTGTVLNRKSLEEIADFAVDNDLLIISDEAYEKFVYDGARHISMASLNGMKERTLTLQSFSKSYAMPGFRVGYAAGPGNVINAMKKLHIFSSICAPTVSQVAALAALNGPQGSVSRMLKEYDRRRKMIYKRLSELPNFFCVKPRGAFYAFPNIKEYDMSSFNFANALIEKAKVAVMPGTEFGMHGEGYIRLSYATSYDLICKAMDKIEKALPKL